MKFDIRLLWDPVTIVVYVFVVVLGFTLKWARR